VDIDTGWGIQDKSPTWANKKLRMMVPLTRPLGEIKGRSVRGRPLWGNQWEKCISRTIMEDQRKKCQSIRGYS